MAFSSQTSFLDSHSLMSEGKHIALDQLLIIIILNFHILREGLEHLYTTVFQILTSAVQSRASHILVAREACAHEVFHSTTTAHCIGNTSESIWVQCLATFTFTVEPRNLIHTDLAAIAIADKALIVV